MTSPPFPGEVVLFVLVEAELVLQRYKRRGVRPDCV